MSLNAATIELLLSKGLTGADLLEVARTLEKKRDNTNAERQARHRAKRARNAVTVTGVTPPPNDIYSNPPPSPSVVSNETTSPSELILVSEADEPDQLKPEHVVEAWNDVAERRGLAKVKTLTPQRRRKLMSRIKEAGVDGFTEAIGTIEASPFLRGENGRGWRADFDWMLEPKNFTKLREGTYGH